VRERDGLDGHSDADVVTHAFMDALLGAAGLEDIGHYFPDDDPAFAGISSLELLRRVASLMRERGYELADADAVVALERPKLAPYREEMRARVADALGVTADAVGIKATTTERLGFTGREEGAAAWAVVLLDRVSETPSGELG